MTRPVSSRSAVPGVGRLGLLAPGASAGLGVLGWDNTDSLDVLWALSRAADPDLALATSVRLREALGDGWARLDSAIRAEPRLRGRLFGLLGVSAALGDHLVADPMSWSLLRADGLPGHGEVAANLLAAVHARGSSSPEDGYAYRAELVDHSAIAALRTSYRRHLMVIAALDLAGTVDDEVPLAYQRVTQALTELADAALSAAFAVAVAAVCPRTAPPRVAVIAMGKCGGRELNYVSDVDVVFVAGEDEQRLEEARRIAAEVMRLGRAAFFEVDAALRPEGRQGPLVRTLDSHLAYYRRWARTWEFQALLKARPMCGDLELAQEYCEAVRPMVWTASQRPDFVSDVQHMRKRVEDSVPAPLRERELKLGRGGLRDVEFAVQLLQLVHGRGDEQLQVAGTVEALAALSERGYVGRADAAELTAAYEFLRLLEHRLQLQKLKRTHTLPAPDDDEAMRRLARAAHIAPDGRRDAAGVLAAEIRRTAQRVRQLHEKLFYRPLLVSVAGLDDAALRLSSESAQRQLAALGYATPRNALGHLAALTAGTGRKSRIQTLLLPSLLDWLADTPDPDGGLLAYRRVSDGLAGQSWFLRELRDSGAVAQRLMRVLGTSAYLPDLLINAPDTVRLYADGPRGPLLAATDPDDVARGIMTAAARYDNPTRAVAAARSLRRRELARVASADVLGLLDVPQVCWALSSVWVAVLNAALDAVIRASDATGAAARARETGGAKGSSDPTAGVDQASKSATAADDSAYPPADLAVIGMGRLGGLELSYGSDADVLFVCDPRPGVDESVAVSWANRMAEQVQRLLGAPSTDPPLQLDAGLRPEGRNGPLVRTLHAYQAYYRQWAQPWEVQALLRAHQVAGDNSLGIRFLHIVDPVRYPPGGVSAEAVNEIRRIKARVDAERLPRGADPATHTKLGRGGLADIEWTVQLLQLRHAHDHPTLQNTSTLETLDAAEAADLISADDARLLREAWITVTRARNAIVLARGRAADQLPASGRHLTAVARICGHPDPGEFRNHYLRVTRRAKAVVEELFDRS